MAEMTSKPTEIHLSNPVSEHFEPFIVHNSVLARELGCAVVRPESAVGQHIVICGAGPSLAEHADEWCGRADQVWGCNSALPWLVDNGHKVTHGFAIDQTLEMLREWASTPPAHYLLASSVHPSLTRLIRGAGHPVTFFHNRVGIRKPPVKMEDGRIFEYEDWLYVSLYEPTMRAGSGLNAVTRAVDVANVMGAQTITVLGADCAIRATAPKPENDAYESPAYRAWLQEHTVMHADGGNALASGATPITFSGEIDGRTWHTKPDLMISAVTLTRMVRQFAGRVQLVGDTLPNALADKPEEYLARLPSLGGQLTGSTGGA